MVEVIGIESVRGSLERLNGEVERIVKAEIRVAAINIQSGARQRCPVDTGRLRNSITHDIRDAGLAAVVGTNVHYAPYVELGTRFMAAQPYLFPAFEDERHKLQPRIIREIQRAARAAA